MTEERGRASSRTYGGWQLEKVAFLFGLSGKRAVMLAGAVLAAIMPIAMVRISSAAVLWPVAVLHGLWLVREVADDPTLDHCIAGTTATARFAITSRGQPPGPKPPAERQGTPPH
jgi:hypothetical protein